MSFALPLAAALLAAGSARQESAPEAAAAAPAPAITVESLSDRLAIRAGDEPFCEYRFAEPPLPILYPLLAPGGVSVTRDWPMVASAPGPRDHPHHRSLWFAHGDVNGLDFWQGGEQGERIVQAGILVCAEEDGATSVHSANLWQAGERPVCLETRVMRFSAAEDGRRIDFCFRLLAAGEPVVFGDTKEGTFALRLAPELALAGERASGHARNSAGDEDGDVWGKRATWVEYSGTIGEQTIGVALFDHPTNLRHPTWWHARDYGLVAANPFGIHDFEGGASDRGELELAPGETLTLRYRLWLHEGAAEPAALDREFESFAATSEE